MRRIVTRSIPLYGALLVGVVTLAVVGLVASGWLAHGWNLAVESADTHPAFDHLLGTDRLGRSVLDKILIATPGTIGIAVAGALLATTLGTIIGAVAGMSRGLVDEVIVWLFSTVGSIPGILLMIGLSLVFGSMPAISSIGHGWLAMALALGLTGWIGTARLIRNEVRSRRDAPFVEAARSLGLGPVRVWWSHILPLTTHLIIIEFASHLAGYIQAGVILSFLGAGPADALSWGALIDEGRLDLARGVWWQLVAASAAVLTVAVAAHILADELRDRLDPTSARHTGASNGTTA
jgi:peptide/nickel transport system permease protein